jgi:dolichyl-phosphate-mannose--protein O-mannosyl transferase
MAMALSLAMGYAIGPPDASTFRRSLATAASGAFLILVLVNFAWLYAVLAGQVLPYDDWHQRMWFPSWV